ncbi:hypothetical protein FRC04_005289 [Tulasnella sp. 424]|nr:hypothetical protein FRC04_005289 [Tulasnella sp. 424]KAG8976401.1 hypothetical protein FRC05_003644 [Tulasnella sp. 425]
MLPRILLSLSLATSTVLGQVTVYTSATGTAAVAQYTVASTDQTVLVPPAPPADFNPNTFIQLYDGGMTGMGNPVGGTLLGFSIELSVAAMLMGDKPEVLRPEFLNYCAILASRAGGLTIRVGGNSQDRATLNLEGNPNGRTIEKYKGNTAAPTETPEVHFTLDLLRVMAEISKHVNVRWFFGIPFLRTNSDDNASVVVQQAMSILGDRLLGLQLANEPDLYGKHLKKWPEYSITDFLNETNYMIGDLPIQQPNIVGPSVCCEWTIDQLLDAGYMDQFTNQLKFVDVMHYPHHNCYGPPNNQDPQELYPGYLNHHEVVALASPYFPAANRALAGGKKFMMMETNTASCGGFPGISDSFTSALWAVDYAMQMAYGNFTYGLLHFGGQNVYYNPFTPPPTNMTRIRGWNTGAIFYAQIVAAEALGSTDNARVIDLQLDNNSQHRAGYAIYENGVASRLVLVNYVQPTSPGANDYTATFAIGGAQTGLPSVSPTSVKVKYLVAPSVGSKDGITWAGQTFGPQFMSDGRLQGDLQIETVQCNGADGTCSIRVPGPGVALVFLNDAALKSSGAEVSQVQTFATTTTTGRVIPTMDQAELMSSNGRNGKTPIGSTSEGSANGAQALGVASWLVSAATVAVLAKLLL